MLKFFLSFILVSTTISHAFGRNLSHKGLRSLVQDLLRSNAQLESSKAQVEVQKLAVKWEKDRRTWALSAEGSYTDSKLDSTSTTSYHLLKETNYELSLGKEFFWGGEFSVFNTWERVNRDRWGLGLEPLYGISQGLSYKQNFGKNFFGRQTKTLTDKAYADLEKAKREFNKTQNGLVQNIGKAYYTLAMQRSLKELKEQAYLRAVRRRKLVSKRVRDGLRRKVDLYQGQMNELSSKEEVEQAEIDYRASKEILSDLLHREILDSEILPLDRFQKNKIIFPQGEIKNNSELKFLEDNIASLKKNYALSRYNVFPNITLSTQLKNNDYDSDSSKVWSEGHLFQGQNEFVVAINFSMPLGFAPEKAKRSQARVSLESARFNHMQLEKSLLEKEKSIKDRLDHINKNHKSSLLREDLAQKTLKEYNRLYSLGHADLDQVLEAERELIRTQISAINYVSTKEKLLLDLAGLYGDVTNYVLE